MAGEAGERGVPAAPVRLRDARRGDLASVTALHLAAFPDFPTTRLGPEFMTAFYEGFLSQENAMFRVGCAGDGTVLGYVAGSTAPRRHYQRFYSTHVALVASAAVRRLARDPAFAWPLVRRAPRLLDALLSRLCRLAHRPGTPASDRARTLALLFIAVADQARGAGVGTQLLADFESQARARGCSALEVRADVHNEAGRRFYEHWGFAADPAGDVLRFRKRLGPHGHG